MRNIYASRAFWSDEVTIRGKVRGSTKSATIYPDEFGWAKLTLRILAALADMVETDGLSQRTAEGYAVAVRSFGRFLASYRPARNLLLGVDNGCFEECHFAWEQDMAAKDPASSGSARHSERILVLMRYLDAEFIPLGKSITERLQSGPYIDRKPTKPRQEFSNADRLTLRDAARAQVRAMEERLADGRKLLASLHQEEPGDAACTAELLAKLHDGELGRQDLSQLSEPNSLPWPKSVDVPTTTSFRAIGLLRALLDLLSPNADDLVAFEVLLLFETGWAPEELRGLRISEFVDAPEGRTYLKHKPRAHKSSHELVANAGGNWSTNALIDRWLSATEAVRRHCRDGADDFVFILGRYARDERGWLVDRPPSAAQAYGLRRWIATRHLEVSEPHHIGRIRKTVKLIQSLRAGTLAGAASGDHHVDVFKGHYLPTTTIYALTPVILRNATDKLFVRMTEHASDGPLVVAAHSSKVAKDDSLPIEVQQAAESVATETEADRNMLPVSCKNILDSPFAGPGTLCPERIRQCFSCSNSIVFEDHLPRVLSLADRLEEWDIDDVRDAVQVPIREGRVPDTVALFARWLDDLAKYAPALTGGFPEGIVWSSLEKRQWSNTDRSKKRGQLQTQPIDPAAFFPLVAAAAAYVQEFSPDILYARRRITELTERQAKADGKKRWSASDQDLEKLLTQRHAFIPLHTSGQEEGTPNYRLLSLLLSDGQTAHIFSSPHDVQRRRRDCQPTACRGPRPAWRFRRQGQGPRSTR